MTKKHRTDLTWLAVGDAVQIRQDALLDDREFGNHNRLLVAEHGYLWVVHAVDTYNYDHPDAANPDDDEVPPKGNPDTLRYDCRSIVTGAVETWIRYELNAAGETEDG